MIRGFYTALSGVISSMTRQAVVADNIASALGDWTPVDQRDTTTTGNAIATGLVDFELPPAEMAVALRLAGAIRGVAAQPVTRPISCSASSAGWK